MISLSNRLRKLKYRSNTALFSDGNTIFQSYTFFYSKFALMNTIVSTFSIEEFLFYVVDGL
jgi:hypothetical protein